MDETVESGVRDLQRIQIDDIIDDKKEPISEDSENKETNATTSKEQNQTESDPDINESFNSSGNRSNETLCPQFSPSQATRASSTADEQALKYSLNSCTGGLTSEDSETLIVELITQSAWMEAVEAFRKHKQKWPETFAADFENHIGILGDEEDLHAMLKWVI